MWDARVQKCFIIALITRINLDTLYLMRRVVYVYYFSAPILLQTQSVVQPPPLSLDPIEEQWNRPPPANILSYSWINLGHVKKVVKTRILTAANLETRPLKTTKFDSSSTVLLRAVLSIFELRRRERAYLVSYPTLLMTAPSIHAGFMPRNFAWYPATRVERHITFNRRPNEILERAGVYHGLQQVPYMPARISLERLRNILDRDEVKSSN